MGDSRIGLAVGNHESRLATPIGYINRKHLQYDVLQVLGRAAEQGAGAIVVGIPLTANSSLSPQGLKVATFVKALRSKTELPVNTTDERYSTIEAERLLRQVGRQPSREKGSADAAAAAVILQGYLDKLNTEEGDEGIEA